MFTFPLKREAGRDFKGLFQNDKLNWHSLIKKSSVRTAFIKDLPVAEANMLMDDQV